MSSIFMLSSFIGRHLHLIKHLLYNANCEENILNIKNKVLIAIHAVIVN